jgi:hypothetical protein
VEKWIVDSRFLGNSNTAFRTVITEELCWVAPMLSQGTNKEGLVEFRCGDKLAFLEVMI